MKYVLISLATIVIVLSSCKKELQTGPGTNSIEAQSIVYDPPPPPGTCAGNTWNYGHPFYADWRWGFASDLQPIAYNDKIYVPDYEDQEIRIFDGNDWAHLPSHVPIVTNHHTMGFALGNMCYVGNTFGPGNMKFYRYNPATNSWLRKADCPSGLRYGSATFTIGTKGYMAGGTIDETSIVYKDLWEYNPSIDTWTKKADMPTDLFATASFVLNDKAYLVGGRTDNPDVTDVLYEYNPATNTWAIKAPYPGGPTEGLVTFVINGKAYVGGGFGSGEYQRDYYRYNPTTNTWTRVADLSLTILGQTVYGFSIKSSGYVACHYGSEWKNLYTAKYSPLICSLP